MAAWRPRDIFSYSNYRPNNLGSFSSNYENGYGPRKSSFRSYTGLSSEWKSRRPCVPIKYRGSLYQTNIERESWRSNYSSLCSNQPLDKSQDDELIVYQTEVVLLNQNEDERTQEASNSPVQNNTDQVKTTFENALKLWNSFKLDEAEIMFLKLYPYDETTQDCNETVIQIFMKLADINLKKSRLTRGNPLESQWLKTHSIALLERSIQLCEQEIQAEFTNCNLTWYREQKEIAAKKLCPIEENVVKSLHTYLQNDMDSIQQHMLFSLSAPTTPTGDFNFPLTSNPLQQVFPGVQFSHGSLKSLDSENDSFPGGVQWIQKFQTYCQDRLSNPDSVKIVEELFSLNKEISDFLSHDYGTKKDLEVDSDKTIPYYDEKKVLDNRDVLDEDRMLVSPLQPSDIKLTLAKLLTKLADRVLSDGLSAKAEAVYKQSKDIAESVQDVSREGMLLYAQISKKLAMVQIKLGYVTEGMKLLKMVLEKYRDLDEEASGSEIAQALVEIGDSYTLQIWDEETVFSHVIDVIQEAFDKESSDEDAFHPSEQHPDHYYGDKDSCQTIDKSLLTSLTDMSSSLCNEQNIQEAILCYEEAIDIFESIHSVNNNSTVYARAITKLGDALFIQKKYHEALQRYEKAQTLFRSTSGRSALIQHGHVLCMLGTTSFMLHLYPKSVMVFECAYRMLKHAYIGENPYKLALILSLLGLASYKLQHYHRCIPWCYRAYEMYLELFENAFSVLPSQKLWIVCQTLYILGNSYNMLNLHEKATQYLTTARSVMKVATNTERRQYMRVLQVLGDCYFAQYDYKTALTFYNEALEDFEGESFQLIKAHQNIAELNQCSDDKGFHNQLLSRSADAHLHLNQYSDAFGFLTQVSSIQDVLEDDINGDLVTTLLQLGKMHSLAGDAAQAIQSYKDCVEIYQEVHGALGPEMSIVLGNLATMCFVKSCMCEDLEEELEMTLAVEQNFQDAISLENNPSILVKYSSFLHHQDNYDDAVIYLHDALKALPEGAIICYSGLEKVILPEVLQDEIDDQEEISFPTEPIIHFLLLVSHKALGEITLAEKHLLALMKYVILKGDKPVMFSLVAYGLMNIELFEEAAEFFALAFHKDVDYHLAMDNYCTCLAIIILRTLQKSFENIYFFISEQKKKASS